MRVVLVQPYAHYAGHHWRDTRSLAAALSKNGVEVDVVVAGPPLGGGEFGGRIFQSLPSSYGATNRIYNVSRQPRLISVLHNLETLACVLRLCVLMVSCRYDVVHFMDGTHLLQFAFILRSGKPVVLSIFGDYLPPPPGGGLLSRFKHSFRALLLRKGVESGRFAVICETESIQARGRQFFGKHIHVIPYAIEWPQPIIARAEARARLGLPPDGPILLLFGTQRTGKDYRVVFEAARSLACKVHLLFVGKIISDNDPRRLAAQSGFTEATFIDRFVADEEVPLFFSASDAVLLPYDAGFDRGSGVILDACRFGLPVISARTGYLEWFVEHYRTGFLFAPGDARELRAAIAQLLGLNEAEKELLRKRIATTAESHSWPVLISDYLAIYDNYLG